MTDREKSLGQLETSLADLEALVERLEAGDLPLEQALAEFERGMQLTRQCQSVLRDAEQKVEILLANSDDAEPFDAPAGAEPSAAGPDADDN